MWWIVVSPPIDSIGYRQRLGSVLTTIEGYLRKFVQDASGLKGDQGLARTQTVVRASGMSKPFFFQLVVGSS